MEFMEEDLQYLIPAAAADVEAVLVADIREIALNSLGFEL